MIAYIASLTIFNIVGNQSAVVYIRLGIMLVMGISEMVRDG